MTSVLIVDDDENIRVATSMCLQSAGYETLTAADTDDVIRLMKDHDVSVMIVDIFLNNQLGISLVERFRARAKILVISGSDQNLISMKDLSMNLGAHAFLEKPFSSDVLLKRVESLLRDADS